MPDAVKRKARHPYQPRQATRQQNTKKKVQCPFAYPKNKKTKRQSSFLKAHLVQHFSLPELLPNSSTVYPGGCVFEGVTSDLIPEGRTPITLVV
jgi:hypothetical protein